MEEPKIDDTTRADILAAQRNEITEYRIYKKLAGVAKDAHNREILERIAGDELDHYNFWKSHTGEDVEPDRFTVWKYYLISRIFGLTFGIKLLERGEKMAQASYERISKVVPTALDIARSEEEHENKLIDMIDEERLRYVGSIVLGLNDALVELTGTLAGLTLALNNTSLIATAGLITGIAASLSMAASEYLSTKAEHNGQNPIKASLYTGAAYVLTVIYLVFPYFVFENYFFCLGVTVLNALTIILVFTLYISIARDIPFLRRFLEMASISLGIAVLTFFIGYLIRVFLGVEV